MREIKFRGQMNHGVWVYGDLLYHSNCDSASIATDEEHCWPVKPDTVGQFTGLKDCEGREVYEGDILVNPNYVRDVRVIEWRDYQWSMVSHTHPFQETVPMIWVGGYRVVGNVHDNPELLERKP